jgi:hypothetical protein
MKDPAMLAQLNHTKQLILSSGKIFEFGQKKLPG